MTIFSALYQLLIGPLELFFEVLFVLANKIIQNPGFSIIFLSLAMNFLVLPLYRRADLMQEEERHTEERLGKWTKHIKKNFKGDERYMIMQTYYRQNHYKPTYALKGSVSLLLEIPFFMAAYNFLSSLPILKGFSFGPIADLGAPDAMFMIGSFTVNILPILMTAINLVSSAIYTKGLPTKSKVQLYVMAALFLVLLYDSPAGLVFYWTLNNLFSLLKNIFYKLKNPKFVLCCTFSAVSAVLLAVMLLNPVADMHRQLIIIVSLALLQLPLIFYFITKHSGKKEETPVTKKETAIFRLGTVFITLLTGVLIPTAVMNSSPEEFINTFTCSNPLWYILNAALLACGTFVIWFGIFYMLAGDKGKRMMSLTLWITSGIFLVDYMFFGKNFGNLSPNLAYDNDPYLHLMDYALNCGVLILVGALFYFVWKKKQEIAKAALLTACGAMVVMSGVNVFGIRSSVAPKLEELRTQQENAVSIPLSKNGKNVVVFMMDRAINSFIPHIMKERPQLMDQFAGFTYYPNTISYGTSTNFGSPALFGGYEYTPEEMNKRDKELLKDKHNEAMRVMPVVFDEENFDVTVCDPTYAGYRWIPDLSIYDDHPNIHAYNTMGKYVLNPEEKSAQTDSRLNRDFFCYSMFKSAPAVAQPLIYDGGKYNAVLGSLHHVVENPAVSSGYKDSFMRAYAVLHSLPKMTTINDGEKNTFMMMSNDTTHEPMLLQTPDYVPSELVNNEEYDKTHTDRLTAAGRTIHLDDTNQMTHYHANMAAMIQLGQWFDYLREQGVYDNTRIIIVSDHGRMLYHWDEMLKENCHMRDLTLFNPLLMVKDFGSKEFTTDNQFMTNADVPTLATDSLVENPTNPFTGKPLSSAPKQGNQMVFTSYVWSVEENNGTTFLEDGWLSVHDNIFDLDNWVDIKDNVQK